LEVHKLGISKLRPIQGVLQRPVMIANYEYFVWMWLCAHPTKDRVELFGGAG